MEKIAAVIFTVLMVFLFVFCFSLYFLGSAEQAKKQNESSRIEERITVIEERLDFIEGELKYLRD
jgi:hypothetical protein